MEKILMHEHIIPIKGIKKKTIYHFSDSHLSEYDALSDKQETETAKEQAAAWENMRKDFAEKYGEPYGEAQQLNSRIHFENLLRVSADGDALVLTGDILNHVNGANLRLTEKILSAFPIPFLAVSGNHEKSWDIPKESVFSSVKNPVQILDLGDLLICGLDNANREITSGQNAALKDLFRLKKSVLIAMHIPIMTEQNKKILTECGEYFQLNYNECPAENLNFINIIKENAEYCAAVLAGHLHFNNISAITPGVTQYVSSQGITGNINRYIIGE